MFPNNLPSGIHPSDDMTITTNDATAHFLEYDCFDGSGIQKEKPQEEKKGKPKTWQKKTYEERDRNLRRFFRYD